MEQKSPRLPWRLVIEWTSEGEGCFREIKKVYADTSSAFQTVMVAELASLGKSLIIDGKVQSSISDEHWYHEALVHPILLAHDNPRRVLILGGGEGATAREVLKHSTVKEVIMVDIDRSVIDFAKKYLEEWHQGAFNDDRLRLVIDDGRAFVEKAAKNGEAFDAVILDLVDPTEGGPAVRLYSLEFYTILKDVVGDKGIIVTQATSPTLTPRVYAIIFNTISRVFGIARPYVTYVRSYNGLWGFVSGSESIDPAKLSPHTVAERIKRRIEGKLRFYDEVTHMWMFSLPKPIRNLLSKVKEYATDNNPVFVPI
ncbi:spermine/spermidine synthase domain-containing protein [Pyrofollis japonicus]|uniref:spermine/spermidine synthase domain-containing protein n=1 Tax=Pyrofollis japonicus TaxID=3060460 RepID=UPI00295B6887|nr:spermidine synthase [Pyrofollis japonicus]